MENLFLIFVMAVFAVAILYDLWGHRHGKIRRRVGDWIFLCLLAVGFTLSAVHGIGGLLEQNSRSKPGLYLAYRYLQEGEAEKARASAESDASLTREQKDLLDMLASAAEGNYSSLYFSSVKLLGEGKLKGEQRACVEELKNAAETYLRQDSTSEEFTALFAGEDQEEETAALSGFQVPGPVLSLVNRTLEAEDIQETAELQDYYLLDSKVRSGDPASIDSSLVEEITEKYRNSQEIRKLAVKYYALENNYREALRHARELIEREPCPENYIIYTDVIAQSVYSGDIREDGDAEKAELLREAKKQEEKAGRCQDESQREELLNEAEKLRQEAANVDIYRAINFLEAKKPLLFDSSGLYDTQIAKLYLAAGAREQAREKIYEVLDQTDSLDEDSVVKEPLKNVIDAYNQTTAQEVSPLLKSSVRGFVEAQSQDVIQVNEDTINGKMADYVTSALKYEKLGIFISRVDTSQYPRITAYLNVNGKKEGRWSMTSEFYADDFEVIDTQYLIRDFEMNADSSRAGVDMAIVIDTSGSMAGRPLEEAKTAARACVEAMDADLQQIAVVSYSSDARTVVEKTDSRESLTYGINQMGSGGGTNIPGGIQEGLDSLQGGEAGTRAVILMTDGQDGNTEAMEEAIARANQEETAVYTVGLGDVNEDYLEDIAERTGGKFILADNSTELEDIYLTLQKYIMNHYVLTYTVAENSETDPRYLMVSIPEYQVSARKDYAFSQETDEEEAAESKGIGPAAEGNALLTGVSPGAVSAEEVSRGLTVTVKGENFSPGMHVNIGSLELQNVEVEDANTLTGTLKGTLSAGAYGISARYPDGRICARNQGLYVFRAGVSSGIRIGGTVVKADTIGQISEDTFVAQGNVLINDFIHFTSSLEIKAEELPEDFSLDSGQTTYLGNSGSLSGKGRIYISYPRASETEKSYASMVLDGKDFTVRDGAIELGVRGLNTSMDQSFELTVPGIANVTVEGVSIRTDGIRAHIDQLNLKNILDSVQKGLGGTSSDPEEKEAKRILEKKPRSRQNTFSFQPAGASAGLDLAIRQKDMELGGEITLNVNDALRFGAFGLREIGVKFNTLDENQEYWKVSGAIDFSSIVKGLGGSGVSGMKASISSWYWMFDSMEVSAELYPGIGIYNALYVDQMDLCVEGVSGLLAEAGWISENVKEILFEGQDLETLRDNRPDFQLTGSVKGDVNLFKTLQMPIPEDMTKWGELGTVRGDIVLNFSEPSFCIQADLNLLEHQIANASLRFDQKGFDASAQAQLELEMLGIQLGGGVEMGLETSMEQLEADLDVDGHADCNLLNLHCQGKIGLEVRARYDGTLFSVTITENENEHRFWYEDNGQLFLWDKIHVS